MISKIHAIYKFIKTTHLDTSSTKFHFNQSPRAMRRGGALTNVLVFMCAAIVVGFVSWLLLQHLIFDARKKSIAESDATGLNPVASEAEVTPDKPAELSPEEKMLIKKELERRKAEELAEKLVKKEQERKKRIAKNVKAVEQALQERDWEAAQDSIGLLLDDSYSHVEVVKFSDALEKGKIKERADLLEIQKLVDQAKALDNGKYSPEAIDLLDRALLIYPNHSSTVTLKNKINSYPYSLRVPEDAATLNAAADMLRAGDTAILGEGAYELPALFNKGIKIKGQGEKLTTIECDTRLTSAFTLTGKDQSYTISNLTVTGKGYEDDATERYPLIMLDANLTMRNVTVENGSGHGLAVVSGRLKMEKCNISANAWDGVSVMGADSYAEITDCDISNNYDHGVDFWKGASGKLTNVTASENIGSGVLIMGKGADVHLIQVKTERNSQCGIVINSQAQAKLERVFSSGNLLSGIVVQGSGTKLTCGITVSNKNGEAGFFVDPSAVIENFISATAEGNVGGDVTRKAIVLPKVPAPVETPRVPSAPDPAAVKEKKSA